MVKVYPLNRGKPLLASSFLNPWQRGTRTHEVFGPRSKRIREKRLRQEPGRFLGQEAVSS